MEMKIRVLFFVVMLFCFLMISQSSHAQSDSVSYQPQDSITSNENAKEDTARTENSYDTSGYYFNWKEYPDDAYTSEKIKERISSDTTIQHFKNEDDFWYVKSIEDFKKNADRLLYDRKYRDSLTKEGLLPPDEQVFTQEQNSNAWYLQRWFVNMVWIIIISVFVAAIIYFLLSNKINLFSKNGVKTNLNDAISEEGLFNVNYDQLVQKYTNEKNYRFAVRVLYLQLLQLLSERNIISLQPQFTNAHYLQQLQSSSLYQNFFTVTQHYEYIWYGEFTVSESSFQTVKKDFTDFKNQAIHS